MSTAAQTKPSFSTSQAALQITRDNVSWNKGLGEAVSGLTWRFREVAPPEDYSAGKEGLTFAKANAEQRAAVLKALPAWAEVANIEFVARNDAATDDATILIAGFDDKPENQAAAHAYDPLTKDRSAASLEGDFWFNNKVTSADFAYGSYAYMTVLHELGHTLGLNHPGGYPAAPPPDYAKDAIYREDSRQYTLMSYFEASNTGATHSVQDTTGAETVHYASTLLLHDIAAIQRLYGANMTTRTGDTTYGFNSTEAGSAFDITSADQQVVLSIWDAGGINRLDLSGYAEAQVIDLRAGNFSNAGKLTANISIALGTVIHDAVGGSGNDTITGNDANNLLRGNAGDDYLDGDLGVNAAQYASPGKNFEIVLTAGYSPFTVQDRFGGEGTDTVVGIQELRLGELTVHTGDFLLSRSLFADQAGFFGWASYLFHLYIAEENRAPDALGLYYWAARMAEGAKITDISDSFYEQAETRSIFDPSLSNDAFLTTAYTNMFRHAPDADGRAYWLEQLATQSRGDVLLYIAGGAQGADKTILDNKLTIARAFAQKEGLGNAAWARDVLAEIDASAASVTAAEAKLAGYAAQAGAADTAELVVKLVGVVPTPPPAS
jgi:Ca2+-binding RTX toxin-like protein